MGFATGGRTFFLWGGCMMVSSCSYFIGAHTVHLYFSDVLQSQMHADDFRNDNYGVVSELRDGGYSDDMTLAAIAGNSSTTKNSTFLFSFVEYLLVLVISLFFGLFNCLAKWQMFLIV